MKEVDIIFLNDYLMRYESNLQFKKNGKLFKFINRWYGPGAYTIELEFSAEYNDEGDDMNISDIIVTNKDGKDIPLSFDPESLEGANENYDLSDKYYEQKNELNSRYGGGSCGAESKKESVVFYTELLDLPKLYTD